MSVEREFVIYAILLVALAANPVWFFPHADEPAHEHRAIEITEENRYRYLEFHPEVLECYDARERACAFEVAALENNTTVKQYDTVYEGVIDYEYVLFSTGFYEPAAEERGDLLRLTLEPRTVSEVLHDLSYPYADASDQARRIVRKGNATVRHEIPDRDRIVRRNETYYALRSAGVRGPPLDGWVPRLRWLVWLGTVPLSFAAMWRWC